MVMKPTGLGTTAMKRRLLMTEAYGQRPFRGLGLRHHSSLHHLFPFLLGYGGPVGPGPRRRKEMGAEGAGHRPLSSLSFYLDKRKWERPEAQFFLSLSFFSCPLLALKAKKRGQGRTKNKRRTDERPSPGPPCSAHLLFFCGRRRARAVGRS